METEFKPNYKKLKSLSDKKGYEVAQLQKSFDYAEHVLKGIIGEEKYLDSNWSANDYDDKTGDLINALDNMMHSARDLIATL